MRELLLILVCSLSAALATAECVEVTSGPATSVFRISARSVRITAVQDGKPLANVRLSFNFQDDLTQIQSRLAANNSKLVLTTDKHGNAMAPDLAAGKYQVTAIGPEHEYAELYLQVADSKAKETSSFLIKVPPTFPPEKAPDVQNAPIQEHIREFRGRVIDPSGGFVPGALVQVYRQDSPSEPMAKIKANDDGTFAAVLAPGKYVVFVSSEGFFKNAAGFEIAPEGEAKDLLVALRIAYC
jgi:hypothetical protein